MDLFGPCWLTKLPTQSDLPNHGKVGCSMLIYFFHLVVGTFLRREMTNVQQSTVFATCAVSSWFCLHVQCFALVEKRQ